jgi:serine/threonine-protein kinase
MDKTLSPPAGQLLDGRYLVESWLARGGMATVYLGMDTRLDRTVALKIAHPELASEPEFVRRFIGEARAAARLSSPNVVAVYDQGSDGNIHYLVMEYVPGPTLRALLAERGRLSPREALDVIEGVLAGLVVAHRSGIVHRDVKPENVLLTTGSLVKVADFGLARAVAAADHSRAGQIIGTAAYLAPEQVSNSTSDERTDVYAAGVMLFELLTGSQPHTGETPLAVAYKHVNEIVPAPSSLVAGLPSALDALVALATSRNPDLRPADAGHFLLAVTDVRRGLPISGSRPRGQHAAPPAGDTGSEPGGFPPAGFPGSHAAYPLTGAGQHGNELPGSGQHSSGQHSSGQYSAGLHSGGFRDDGQPGAGRPAAGYLNGESPHRLGPAEPPGSWPGPVGPAFGQPSWPPGQTAGDSSPHAGSGPGTAALASSGEHARAAELLPAPALAPDIQHGTNHTLIVPRSGTADYLAGADDFHRETARGYRRRREPRLQRWLFSRRLAYLVGLLVVALLAGLLIWWLSAGRYTTIPQVRGLSAGTATAELRNDGFTVRAGSGRHTDMPRGEVIRTYPAIGARTRDGSVVTIIESLGPVKITVPPVTGMQLTQAEATLKQNGLIPGTVSNAPSTTVPAGIVTATNPVAGTSWPKTSPVGITVSAGPPLPSFVGGTVAAAQAAAAAGGYTINPIQDPSGKAPAGTIVRQSPAAGTPISAHEVVNVYVSPGPPLVPVPNVDGMPVRQAIRTLEQAGFSVQINKGLGNTVTGYSPNTPAPSGSTITINVGFQL